ncbi:MAG TPA: flippase, partial [Methanomicrobia archaeon]|nr:flippase [Methanomicrobia archaeon]
NMLDDLVGAVTNLSLNALLIPVFGIVGAAVATAISLAALTLLKSVQIYRIHKIHPFATNYLKPVVIYCVLVSVVYAVVNIFWSDRVTFGILIVLSFLFLVMYGLSILITKSFEREDEIILEEVERILGVDASRIKSMLRRFL